MTTWAEAAQAMADIVGKLTTFLTQQLNWAAGAANGGPNGDGRYPFTLPDGTETLIPCPAKIELGGLDTEVIGFVVCADATILTAERRAWDRVAFPFHVSEIRACLAAPSSAAGGNVSIDVRVNGTSILLTKLTILTGQTTSKAAGTPQPVIISPDIPDDAEISIAVLGAGANAKGLRVKLIGQNVA